MKVLAFLFLALSPVFSFASNNYVIEAFPGKVKVLVDIDAFTGNNKVDVLFVIDNSGSMSAHQDLLAKHVDLLTEQIKKSNLDFHVGVITTESENTLLIGKLVGNPTFLTETDKNLVEELGKRLLVGTNGSGWEKPFAALKSALSEPNISTANAGFYRPEAHLALIFVTDAEDQSAETTTEIQNFLTELKGDSKKVMAHGIIVPTAETGCPRDDGSTPQKIESLIASFGGESFSLCSPNYGENLRTVGKNLIKPNPSPTVPLGRVKLPSSPDFQTIEVNYGTQTIVKGDISAGWVFDPLTNEVVFGKNIVWTSQPAKTPLEITYVPADWAK